MRLPCLCLSIDWLTLCATANSHIVQQLLLIMCDSYRTIGATTNMMRQNY